MQYHRSIHLLHDGRVARVELDDNFHGFSLSMHHDGEKIVALEGASTRTPWSTCGDAPSVLSALTGHMLGPGGLRVAEAERAEQCLHLLDMVELAMAHAVRAQGTRTYECSIVRGKRRDDVIDATLTRDQDVVLSWQIDGETIVAAPPYDSFPRRTIGTMKRKAVEDWLRDKLDPDAREAVLVLHRALFVSDAMYFDWNSARSAADRSIPSFCFTHHQARAAIVYPTPWRFRLPMAPSGGDKP